MSDDATREQFIADWAKVLGCDPNAYAIAVRLINVNKNYETAMAVVFGLSWVNHTQYLQRTTAYFKSIWVDGTIVTAEWLGQFVQHYITDKEAYPE